MGIINTYDEGNGDTEESRNIVKKQKIIKEQYILLEAVIDYVNECIVYCTNCEEEFVLTNSYYPEEEFYKLGWRATKYGNVYCPTCASKKLKLKEK